MGDKLLATNGDSVSLLIEFNVPFDILEERICGRWIHKASGRAYHVKFAPPKSMQLDENKKPIASSMKDDETGEPLMQRGDDTAAALVTRLQAYHSQTEPVLKHYSPHGVVQRVDAGQEMDAVWASIHKSMKH